MVNKAQDRCAEALCLRREVWRAFVKRLGHSAVIIMTDVEKMTVKGDIKSRFKTRSTICTSSLSSPRLKKGVNGVVLASFFQEFRAKFLIFGQLARHYW